MIVVTGGAGFIGSNIVAELEEARLGPIVVCDAFETGDKWRNVSKRTLAGIVEPSRLFEFLDANSTDIETVVHMGAISATTERNVDALVRSNIDLTLGLWDWCAAHQSRFVYASSAATYGAAERGLKDDESPAALAALRPLNAYAWSKKATDEIVAQRVADGRQPPQWVGLKFFNVYGPNEYHKNDMRSVVSKMFDTVSAGSPIRLFRSGRADVADGEQRRDFVYVRDCTRAILWLLRNPSVSGIFNLGTGRAESFLDMFHGLETALGRELSLEFMDMPEQLAGRYQYYTEADMTKLHAAGYNGAFRSLHDGIHEYVTMFLRTEDPYR